MTNEGERPSLMEDNQTVDETSVEDDDDSDSIISHGSCCCCLEQEEEWRPSQFQNSTQNDFEGYALVTRLRHAKKRRNLSRFLLGNNKKKNGSSRKERFLLIQGAVLFVFKSEQSPKPKYVIPLAHTTKTRVTHVSRHMAIVEMEEEAHQTTTTSSSLVEHKFVFFSEDHANNFVTSVMQGQKTKGSILIPQRLLGNGHSGARTQESRRRQVGGKNLVPIVWNDVLRILGKWQG